MKQIILSQRWIFKSEPFPAFWAIFAKKKDNISSAMKKENFFHIKGIDPLKRYMVADNLQIYYEGTDWSVADEMKKKHNKRQARFKDFKIFALKILAVNKKMEKKFAKYFSIFEVEIKVIGHVLPENNFRVIKVKKTGNYIVVPGRDETDGCLLFVGCDSEIFGEAGVCRELTTGNILKIFHASLNNFSCIEVAVILEKGQMITFSLNRSNQNLIRSYCWNGREIVCAQDKNI